MSKIWGWLMARLTDMLGKHCETCPISRVPANGVEHTYRRYAELSDYYQHDYCG